MHLVILSGAARPQPASNTAKIISAFRRGYEAEGNTAEVWYLSDRKQWAGAAQAFAGHDHILIALPLYVENIPGILLEFLSGLTPKTGSTEIAFLLQGGFPEASQSDCCLAYLETLPAQLGCTYAGTLHKGDLFGHFVQRIFMGRMAKKMGCRQPLDARPYQDSVSAEHR